MTEQPTRDRIERALAMYASSPVVDRAWEFGVLTAAARAYLASLDASAPSRELETEIQAWRECAKYDALMEGPKFKGWDRSALDRCRRAFVER